jgi:hypothetical protein
MTDPERDYERNFIPRGEVEAFCKREGLSLIDYKPGMVMIIAHTPRQQTNFAAKYEIEPPLAANVERDLQKQLAERSSEARHQRYQEPGIIEKLTQQLEALRKARAEQRRRP